MLALERSLIPPNILLTKINRKIPLDAWNMEIPTTLKPWPTTQLRRMSISSFGLGGTNAHVVMEAHGAGDPGVHRDQDGRTDSLKSHKRLFFLSSQDQGGFARIASSLTKHIDSLGPLAARSSYLADLAHTLATARAGLGWLSSFVAESLIDVREQLTAGLGQDATRRRHKKPRLAFIFTGQGAQWAGMGMQMLQKPVFAASMATSTTYLARLGCDWDPIVELAKKEDESRLSKPGISQAVCTVLQIALVDELRSWGVQPTKVIGHSSGEIAAAYCIGALSHLDAVAAAYFRGKASAAATTAPGVASKKGTGMGMMAVLCSKERVEKLISGTDGGASITVACINSPKSITLSGNTVELDKMTKVLQKHNIFSRCLKVEVAYHSPLMAPVSQAYLSYIANIEPQMEVGGNRPAAVMVSSVTATEITADKLGPHY